MFQLLEDLKEAQLEVFIPSQSQIEKAVSDYIDYGSDGYYGEDGEYMGDDPVLETEDSVFHTIRDGINMREFMMLFDSNGYDIEDKDEIVGILNTPLNEILGITRPQLKLIPMDAVFTETVFPEFVGIIKSYTDSDDACDIAIEDRILLASALAYLSLDDSTPQRDCDQILRIMKSKKDFGSAIAIAREWLDIKKMDNMMCSCPDELYKVFGEECVREYNKEYREMFPDGIYIKASHIHDIHGKMVRFKRKWDAKLQEKDEMKEKLFAETVSATMYRKFTFTDWKFVAKPILSYKELVHEGEALDHCVADYADDIVNNVCMIYSIRECSSPETPLYTAEIKRGKTLGEGTGFRLTQCYGYGDTTEKDEPLQKFILKWCDKKGIKVNCEV